MFILHCRKLPKTELRGFPGHAGPTENPLGKTLFQHLHHDGWISLVRFADQEMEVLGMMAEGLSNKEIAGRLGISDHTVKFHVGSIMAKLQASSRTEAVTQGLRLGLILL